MIRLVSSLDSPFAIIDTFKSGLEKSQIVRVCYPWFEKPFSDLVRRVVPKGTHLDVLTKIPYNQDKTFRSLQAFDTMRKHVMWQSTSTCVPYLHAKFAVVDDRHVFFGSANATNGSLFYSNEVMVTFCDMPELTNRFVALFERIRKQEHNLRWELIRDFHGPSIEKKPAVIVLRYLEKHREARKDVLVKFLEGHQYDFHSAKEIVQRMLSQGILYEPRTDYVRPV